MEIIDLEKIAEREKINIYNFKMSKKAKIIDYNGISILMDYSQIHTNVEEKCCLAEEIAHYYTDSYYTLNYDQTFIDKQINGNVWFVCP